MFSSKSRRARILRSFVRPMLGVAMRTPTSRLIVQNEEEFGRVVQLEP